MRIFLILLVTTSMLSGCENIFFEKDQSTSNHIANFEYIWNEFDKKYPFFEEKGIDWDASYQKYRPLISDNMSSFLFFNIVSQMMRDLKDGHTNLSSPFSTSYYRFERTSQDNFDFRTIQDSYLPKNYYTTGGFAHGQIKINNRVSIGYVRIPSFTSTLRGNSIIDFILNVYGQTNGLIIDMRENGGGESSGVKNLISRFIDKDTPIYYQQTRNGTNKNQFTEKQAVIVKPYSGTKYLGRKVMVLVDRGSYSATSFFALATKAVPNVILVGDRTGGGLGVPNGGQMPNGWIYRFSVTRTLDAQGNSYENGVPVDISVNLDNMTAGDDIINRAIREIVNGN